MPIGVKRSNGIAVKSRETMERIMILSSRSIFLLAFLYSFSFIPLRAVLVRDSERQWEIAASTLDTAETVESKVCEIEFVVEDLLIDFSGTFTALDALHDKICTVDSKVDIVSSWVEQISTEIDSFGSKIELVQYETISMCDIINVVHIDDFGGTWTALDELNDTMCDKLGSIIDRLTIIESKVDQLIEDNTAQFIATFTKLQILSLDVLNTMTKVEAFADQLEIDLMGIESIIDNSNDQLITIESKIDLLEIDIEINFAGTFTAIEGLFAKLCDFESSIDAFDITMGTVCIDTFTALLALEAKVCTVESKVDIINDLLDVTKMKATDLT